MPPRAVQDVRFQTDQEISRQVHTLNELLSAFETNNKAVYSGTQSGRDVSAELDERDSLIKKISEIIGVTTASRTGNDMAIYTSDGITLFETVARPVTFVASSGFAAGIEGKQIYVDGVALDSGNGATTTARGSLQALLQIRDVYAPAIQDQLDEVARALIVTFAEKDQSAVPTLPDAPGLVYLGRWRCSYGRNDRPRHRGDHHRQSGVGSSARRQSAAVARRRHQRRCLQLQSGRKRWVLIPAGRLCPGARFADGV